MNLTHPPFLRRCAVRYSPRPDAAALRRAVLANEDIQSDFVLVQAPLPSQHQTFFHVMANERTLLIGAALLHDRRDAKRDNENLYERESLEVFFDLKNDKIGWQQFVCGWGGAVQEYSHLPYAEVHSSAYRFLRPQSFETREEAFAGRQAGNLYAGLGCRWFFIRFDAREIFKHSPIVGFNICRARESGEFSAWNFPSGNGAPDAQSLGELHQDASTLETSDATRKTLRITRKPQENFQLAMTYDPPMCVINSHYTPARLRREMEMLQSCGISRLHWIDYSDFPSFWQKSAWQRGARKTQKQCGDFTSCAREQAHALGLEFWADFKFFDLGFDSFNFNKKTRDTAPNFEGSFSGVIPEIAAHPEWTMQAHAPSRLEYSRPAALLRFYSDAPIREIKKSQIKLLVSDDNRAYRPYRGDFAIKQGIVSRAHECWTPTGSECEKGAARNWFLELSDLKLSTPFAALCIEGELVTFSNRAWMLLQCEDGDGNQLPVTVATASTPEGDTKYSFWKQWPGWANYTEPILRHRRWSGNEFGFALGPMTSLPTMLEPTFEGAREIWLGRIEKILERGVDGINLRFLCHHNTAPSWLQFAFAPVVIEEFEKRFGREAGSTPEDYQRVRQIRGDAITQLIRESKQLCEAKGKKLMLHFESGIEVPPNFDTRMQIHWDWRRWLDEKLADEICLKWFSPYNRWAQEEVLPPARKQRIPVRVISRNAPGLLDARACETLPRLVSDARRLGFAGFNFYEAANFIEMNPAGVSLFKGLSEHALRAAQDDTRRVNG